MKVLVTGGRDFGWTLTIDPLADSTQLAEFNKRAEEGLFLFDTLDAYYARYGFTHLCHGDAPGADSLANQWCADNEVECYRFRANWEKFGKRAGYLRNQAMLDIFKPDLVIAFPGGKGTAMMCELAAKANVKVEYAKFY